MGAGHPATTSQSGLIIREREPMNYETPLDQACEFLTPNDLFYIRSHFSAPRLDPAKWELRVEGAVRQPFSIGLAELRAMRPVTIPATLECAGNGRVFLSPQVGGVQWQLGAVSTAEWTGVPLRTLLDRAGLAKDACEIVFEGADKGIPKQLPRPPGEIRYARSIDSRTWNDVLIAYSMNGEEIPIDHGYPVRAVVPGHYGMASVKWLTAIRAVREPFRGYWQTSDYAYWEIADGNPVRRPLGRMALKSIVVRPRTRECVVAGETYRVSGMAWSGAPAVEQVEVSTDGGATWQTAEFLDPPQPFVWRRWEIAWEVPQQKGGYVLKSRARDAEGNVQPAEHEKRFGGYVIHHTLGIEAMVR